MLQNISKDVKQPQKITCVLFCEIQEKKENHEQNKQLKQLSQPAHPIWLVDWSAGWLLSPKTHLCLHT